MAINIRTIISIKFFSCELHYHFDVSNRYRNNFKFLHFFNVTTNGTPSLNGELSRVPFCHVCSLLLRVAWTKLSILLVQSIDSSWKLNQYFTHVSPQILEKTGILKWLSLIFSPWNKDHSILTFGRYLRILRKEQHSISIMPPFTNSNSCIILLIFV